MSSSHITATFMRVSTVAICTLAALTARELTQEANANPSSNLSIKEPETDNFGMASAW